jgi:hypothetical protein
MRTRFYALAGVLISLAIPTSAQAFTLGAADGSTAAAPIAKQLGAKTYRVVIDPREGLEHYAPRIDAYQRLGMRPQIVVGGTGTSVRGKTASEGYWMINVALQAHKRWPGSYSIGVQNEPDLSGASACRYAQNFRRAYKALKKAGVKRVLFGEWSPSVSMGWTPAIIKRCKKPVVADGYAWHCYDQEKRWEGAIGASGSMRAWLQGHKGVIHTRAKRALPMYCTEYGVQTRTNNHTPAVSESEGAQMWRNALLTAKREGLKQIVAWGIEEAHRDSVWDSSLVRSDGSFRPAFHTIQNR